jgi:hypothetical protein
VTWSAFTRVAEVIATTLGGGAHSHGRVLASRLHARIAPACSLRTWALASRSRELECATSLCLRRNDRRARWTTRASSRRTPCAASFPKWESSRAARVDSSCSKIARVSMRAEQRCGEAQPRRGEPPEDTRGVCLGESSGSAHEGRSPAVMRAIESGSRSDPCAVAMRRARRTAPSPFVFVVTAAVRLRPAPL